MPGFDIRVTFIAAATHNVLVGIVAIIVASRPAGVEDQACGESPSQLAADGAWNLRGADALDGPRLQLILAVFGLSGVASLALEVVWFRVLTLFLRPTVYGFALMLAAILAGIALGSYLVTPFLDRRFRWLSILACLEFAIAVAALGSFGMLVHMSGWTSRMRPVLSHIMQEWLIYPTVGSLQAIFPTALLMGTAFPIGLRLWADGESRFGRSVAERIGTFYSVNVAGSIVGSVAAGFLLLPRLGSRTSIILIATVSFASGLLLLAACEWRRPTRIGVGLVMCLLFGAGVWASPDPFDEFVAQRYPRQRVVWREEGVEATVVVHARNDELTLTVNGNHQASTEQTMVREHHAIGHLPMVLHPEPRSALVIGLGGGATAGAVCIHDGTTVDVVELAGAVVRGARFFEPINHGVLLRPNVRLRVDDGRNYLLLTDRTY